MEAKKNPQADLNRRTGFFFSIGLFVAVALSLGAINYTSSEAKVEAGKSAVDDVLDENVEEVFHNTPPPPPPPPPPPAAIVPDEIKVVENKVEIKTSFESTETNKDVKVADAPKISQPVDDEPEVEEVPFAVIEDKPMFDACKGLAKGDAQEKCFKENLDRHVSKNFRYPDMAAEMGIQGRVTVMFKITKDGSVSIVGVRGPDKSLEAEARRIIEKLPKFIPGKQRGKPVAVTYAYPIVFKLSS